MVTCLLSGQTPETVAGATPERADDGGDPVRCPPEVLIVARRVASGEASNAGFVVRYWPWRSSARRSGTTSNRKTFNTLCATQWSSRRSPKTPFGIYFSALIAQGDFLSWW